MPRSKKKVDPYHPLLGPDPVSAEVIERIIAEAKKQQAKK